MKKPTLQLALGTAGLILLLGGLYFAKMTDSSSAAMRALPFVCVGIGCGLFGQGVGALIERNMLKKHPQILKQKEIAEKDERNQEISVRAKAKAYDTMVLVFGALMVSLALMGTEILVVLLVVFAYLFVVFSGVYYRIKLEKEL